MDLDRPPFPLGDRPKSNDSFEGTAPPGGLPNWLDDGIAENATNPSVPYWPNFSSLESSTETERFTPLVPPKLDDTLSNFPRQEDALPDLQPAVDQSVPTERILTRSSRRRRQTDLPLPPPFSAGLSKLSPFIPEKDSPAVANESKAEPAISQTPPPANALEIAPASAIWRSRRLTAAPQIDSAKGLAIFRAVIRDEGGRGYANAIVVFPLPDGIKQVQASRKPLAKKGQLHWNLGSVGPDETIPLAVKIPLELLGTNGSIEPRSFEISYQPLPGAKLECALTAPAHVPTGSRSTVSVEVSNSGDLPTGPVMLRIVDRTSGHKPIVVPIEPIGVRESRTVTVELPPQIAGRNDWIATLESSGCEPAETIFSTEGVRAVLTLEMQHEASLRVDAESEIAIKVHNTARVPACNVAAQFSIPEELTFAGAIDGVYDRSMNVVNWMLGELAAGETRTLAVRLRGFSPGFVPLQARAELDGETGTVANSNLFVEIDGRTTSTSLDKLLAAIQENVADDGFAENERPVEHGSRHIVFQLAGSAYAIPLANVREVARPERTTPVPGTPDWAPGVANVRGDILTIVDLPRFLGLGDDGEPRRGLLVAQANDGRSSVGVLVNQIIGIRRLPSPRTIDRDRYASSPTIDFLDGLVDHGGQLVSILRMDELIQSTESRLLSM
jgi:chemotaxis signal transduction protein